jgi:hypothetical protein
MAKKLEDTNLEGRFGFENHPSLPEDNLSGGGVSRKSFIPVASMGSINPPQYHMGTFLGRDPKVLECYNEFNEFRRRYREHRD